MKWAGACIFSKKFNNLSEEDSDGESLDYTDSWIVLKCLTWALQL